MTIHLTPEQERRVQAVISRGAYESVDEVVEAALAAVEQRTVPGFAGTQEELDTLLAEGLAAKEKCAAVVSDIINAHDPSTGRSTDAPPSNEILQDIQALKDWVTALRDRQKRSPREPPPCFFKFPPSRPRSRSRHRCAGHRGRSFSRSSAGPWWFLPPASSATPAGISSTDRASATSTSPCSRTRRLRNRPASKCAPNSSIC